MKKRRLRGCKGREAKLGLRTDYGDNFLCQKWTETRKRLKATDKCKDVRKNHEGD